VLKGAMLLRVWSTDRYRATWDLDLLGRGEASPEAIAEAVRDLCAVDCDDGIVFDPASVSALPIRVAREYGGIHVTLTAGLDGALIPVRIDVAFGDAVVPAPGYATYPVLLDLPAPHVLAYPREAVVAEKIEAMATLGVLTSRMKDFYDIHALATEYAFDGTLLSRAITATFERRRTPAPVPGLLVLTPEFLDAPERRIQWRAFRRRSRLAQAPEGIGELGDRLRQFIEPPLAAIREGLHFEQRWQPGGPWRA
jgi:hypothetical protein